MQNHTKEKKTEKKQLMKMKVNNITVKESEHQPRTHRHIWLTLCFNPSAAHHPKMLSEVPVGCEIKEEGQQRTEEEPECEKKREEAVGGWVGERGVTKWATFSVKILHPQKVKRDN